MKNYKLTLAGIFLTATAALLFSCGKETSSEPDPDVPPGPDPVIPKQTVVYAAGQEIVPGETHYYATIWRDGKRYLLTDGSADGFCNAVCADGDMVYVVGCEAVGKIVDDGYYEPYAQNVGILWQFRVNDETNITRTVLSDGEYATSPAAVSVVNGDIYIVGFDSPGYDRRAVYWKNGHMTHLTDGTTDALAYCVLAVGSDVYIGGYVQPADNKQGGIARIWKNGVVEDLTDGSTVAKVNALFYENGVLYAAGAEKAPGGRWKGVLWTNGRPTYFTGEVGTEVTGLHVEDGRYMIEGTMTQADGSIVTCVWTPDGVQILSEGLSLCQGVGLAVAGDDVYVAGNEVDFDYQTYEDINRAHLWKNGAPMQLEVTNPDNVSLWGVTCAFVDKEE